MFEGRGTPMSGVWKSAARRLCLALAATLAMASATPGRAASFVDASLPDVAADKRVVVAHPQPVQLLFQFETKGTPNARATAELKPAVLNAVRESGVFSEVADGPVENGAILNIVIDNAMSPSDLHHAEGAGFATGATLFIAGSTTRDHYICTIDYIGGPDAPKITRKAEHSVLFQMGLINSTPANAVKVPGGLREAVSIMTRQIVSNPLNELASDPGFVAPAPATPAQAAVLTPVNDPAAATAPANPAVAATAQPQTASTVAP